MSKTTKRGPKIILKTVKKQQLPDIIYDYSLQTPDFIRTSYDNWWSLHDIIIYMKRTVFIPPSSDFLYYQKSILSSPVSIKNRQRMLHHHHYVSSERSIKECWQLKTTVSKGSKKKVNWWTNISNITHKWEHSLKRYNYHKTMKNM